MRQSKGGFSSVAQANGGLEKWKAVYTWIAACCMEGMELMVKKKMRDPLFLAQKSVDATGGGCLSLKGVRPCTRLTIAIE